MAKIIWDQTGERRYETGVDHGVLYLTPQKNKTALYTEAVPWNGLTSVSESPSGAEPTPLWADNMKYLNLISREEFGASVEAYTYPEEFGRCDGTFHISKGVSVGQQRRESFGLAYRTKLGNDVEGDSYGYKLHLVYGATAAPSEKAFTTVNDSPEAITFNWTLSTVPVSFDPEGEFGDLKPTSILTINSTEIPRAQMAKIEDILYGSGSSTPRLPLPEEVAKICSGEDETPNRPPQQPQSLLRAA